MTFLIHPEHGATNVSPAEVEEHEKNGWKVSTHAEWMALAEPKQAPKPAVEPVNRRGRPPKAE